TSPCRSRPRVISSRLSRGGTSTAPSSSPPTAASPPGARSSTTPPWPPRSSTDSSTTAPCSRSTGPATGCATTTNASNNSAPAFRPAQRPCNESRPTLAGPENASERVETERPATITPRTSATARPAPARQPTARPRTASSGVAARRGRSRLEVEPPVVAAHPVARWEFEITLPEQREAELPADRVRGRIVDRRERVQKPTLPVRPGHGDRLPGGLACDAPALEPRQHHPADLIDNLAAPVLLPVPDRAGRRTRFLDDLQHPPLARVGQLLVAMLAVGQLLGTLGPAEMLRHRGITHQLLDEWEVPLAPRLEPDHASKLPG